jgi:excisionase family DNA binding protein
MANEAEGGCRKRLATRLTLSVPEAGEKLGIGRNAAYEAAKRGDLPVVRFGKRLVVPIAALEQLLAVQSRSQIVAAELVRRLQNNTQDEPEAA